jgi:hypothetical protein
MLWRINFFALKADLFVILNEVESKRPLRFTLIQDSVTPRVQEWFRGTHIPELGQAYGEQAALCHMFLLTDWQSPVFAFPHQLMNGETRFVVDQSSNPDSVVMNPAGKWKSDIVIAGSFATISDSSVSQALMGLLNRTIRNHFTRIKAFWVGPEAMIGFRQGYRLTVAEQSPPEFDLCD